MEAAAEEFAKRGVESASYNKIIEKSGLSKGTVYYYFDNKDSLLSTVLDEICERFRRSIGDLRLPNTKEEYWATAEEYHSRAMKFFLGNPIAWRVLLWISKDLPRNDEYIEACHTRTTRFLGDLIVRGREIGAVRDDFPVETAQRLMHAIGKILSTDILKYGEEEVSTQATGGEEQAKIEKFMRMMHDLSRRILTPEEDLICCEHY
jgi:AcrR family transcriptional regulator